MTDTSQPTAPTWQQHPCPGWCARPHTENDHPEDRSHRSIPSYVPVLAAVDRAVPILANLEAVDLVVGVGRYGAVGVEWLSIEAAEAPQPRLVLTLESARLLLNALTAQLEAHDFDTPDRHSSSKKKKKKTTTTTR